VRSVLVAGDAEVAGLHRPTRNRYEEVLTNFP
jgi:hypothetical protein